MAADMMPARGSRSGGDPVALPQWSGRGDWDRTRAPRIRHARVPRPPAVGRRRPCEGASRVPTSLRTTEAKLPFSALLEADASTARADLPR
jgi:hypothetical protein